MLVLFHQNMGKHPRTKHIEQQMQRQSDWKEPEIIMEVRHKHRTEGNGIDGKSTKYGRRLHAAKVLGGVPLDTVQ